jgi:hypothetical protein
MVLPAWLSASPILPDTYLIAVTEAEIGQSYQSPVLECGNALCINSV